MSATLETSNVAWRKRRREEEASELQIEMKKPRYYYYRLASESSKNSEEDTESVYSLQDRETDVVRDTSDTDSRSGSDADEYELIEYEVASLSESEDGVIGNSTSDSDEVIFAAAIDAMYDSSLETWITECEDSDNGSLDSVVTRLGFSTCVQCKSENDNPLYRYCEKCFQTCKQCKKRKTYKCFPLCVTCHQDRKKFYPPRPRGNKKPKKKLTEPPVKLDLLRSCLNGLSSQDSGVGSSQECPPLELDRIVVPDNLKSGTSEISSLPDILHKKEQDFKRKRQASESSLSDFEIKKPKFSRKEIPANFGLHHNLRSSNSQEKYLPVSQIVSKDNSSSLIKNPAQDQLISLSPTSNDISISLSQASTETALSSSQDSIETSSSSSKSSEKSLSLSQTSDTALSLIQTEKSTKSFSKPSEKSLSLRSHSQTLLQSKSLSLSQNIDRGSEISTSSSNAGSSTNSESSELCIMCNSAPKDSIFLHTNIGHQCCCYKCAKRTLHAIKRCPICNRSVNKVVRIFQA